MTRVVGLVTAWRPSGRHALPLTDIRRTMDHVLERQLLLPIRQKEAWDFFSTPLNLSRITPPNMGFEILSTDADRPIFEGMLIKYRVKPMLGVPLNWSTGIRNVNAPFSFTDVQLVGPFAKWEHDHEFIGTPHGVLMKDRVVYRLPMGWIGRVVHSLIVRKRVEAIFDHREHVLKAIFGGQ